MLYLSFYERRCIFLDDQKRLWRRFWKKSVLTEPKGGLQIPCSPQNLTTAGVLLMTVVGSLRGGRPDRRGGAAGPASGATVVGIRHWRLCGRHDGRRGGRAPRLHAADPPAGGPRGVGLAAALEPPPRTRRRWRSSTAAATVGCVMMLSMPPPPPPPPPPPVGRSPTYCTPPIRCYPWSAATSA